MTTISRRWTPARRRRRQAHRPDPVLVGAVRDCLEHRGYLVIQHPARLGAGWGCADLQALRNGICLFVLVNSTPCRLSRRQQWFADNVRRSGHCYAIVRSAEDALKL
jgi:hypothetical protein